MDEEKFFVCPNCDFLQFDLTHPEVKVISQTAKRALVQYEGRAHSLVKMSWSEILRGRSFADQTLEPNTYWIYQKPRIIAERDAELERSHQDKLHGPRK